VCKASATNLYPKHTRYEFKHSIHFRCRLPGYPGRNASLSSIVYGHLLGIPADEHPHSGCWSFSGTTLPRTMNWEPSTSRFGILSIGFRRRFQRDAFGAGIILLIARLLKKGGSGIMTAEYLYRQLLLLSLALSMLSAALDRRYLISIRVYVVSLCLCFAGFQHCLLQWHFPVL